MKNQPPEIHVGISATGQSVRILQGLHHQDETSVPGLGISEKGKTEIWT